MAKRPKPSPCAAAKDCQREFIKLFNSMCGKHSRYEVWQDFVLLTAIEFSNAVDAVHRDERTQTYRRILQKYTAQEQEPFAGMLAQIILGMEKNPDQDFLGDLYMSLELGNDHAGQFFTPYTVCKMMAKVTCSDISDNVKKQGWISVNDPACGAGATLIAVANLCREKDVNYQQHCLFVAQDIDYTVACMCYIQLSLLGCPGYVIVGNTLTNPGTSHDGRGLIPVDDGNVWYTPMYFTNTWALRRMWARVALFSRPIEEVPIEDAPVAQASPASEVNPSILSEPKLTQAVIREPLALNVTEAGQLTLF
jgi:hypothetical protein